MESPTLARVCHRPDATRIKTIKNEKPHTSESLLSTTCNANKNDKNGKPHTSGSLSLTMCDAIINDNKRYLTRNGTRDVLWILKDAGKND